MKILLLGATGRTGKLVLKKALESGHQVICLARNVQRIEKRNGLFIIEGNPIHASDLEKAISGCDAVIGVLNISRKSDFPWSRLKTPKKYLSEVMNVLLPIAARINVQRIVVCSAWGVSETKSEVPGWFRWFIDISNIGVAYEDHERQEKLLMGSNLDWTIVRPAGLTNSRRKENIRETYDNFPKPSLMISRKSLANFLVDSLERIDLVRKKVVISKGH